MIFSKNISLTLTLNDSDKSIEFKPYIKGYNSYKDYNSFKSVKKSSSASNIFNEIKNKVMKNTKRLSLIEIEKIIHQKFLCYYLHDDYYNILKIDEIINNDKSHLVAEFKDFLVYGDIAEFLQEYYYMKEIKLVYPQILSYYKENLFIFPNYITLYESKYIYSNIQKKQIIIDIQEENEEKEEKKKKREKKGNYMEPIFTIKEIDSLLNQTDSSGIKQCFDFSLTNTENSNGIDKNEQQILKLITIFVGI